MTRMRYAVFAGALAAALVATSASAFEFHGYFRDGPGFNSKGGGMVCFQMPGAEFKARLGNECDHYYEFSLSETVYKDDSGVQAKVEWMPASGQDMRNPSSGNNVFTQQIWGGIKLPQLAGATIWAGQRYYRRHNVEGLDWFYWNPYQNQAAAGIEDVDLGFGKLALALGRADAFNDERVVTGTYMVPEVRLYGIPLIPNGTLELGVNLGIAFDQDVSGVKALGADREAVSPWFTVEYFQDKFLGGFNKLTFQYAQGAEARMTNGVLAGANSDPKQWRVIEQVVFLLNNRLSGQVALVYQDQENLLNASAGGVAGVGTGARIFSAEVRPSYHFSDYFKLQLDALYQAFKVKDAGPGLNGTADMLKLTVAPTLVTGRGFFARPEFRLFATYGVWDDAANLLATALGTNIGSGAFGSDRHGFSFGAQVECWF